MQLKVKLLYIKEAVPHGASKAKMKKQLILLGLTLGALASCTKHPIGYKYHNQTDTTQCEYCLEKFGGPSNEECFTDSCSKYKVGDLK